MHIYIRMHVSPNIIGKCTVTWEAQTLVLGSSEGEAFPQSHDWANRLCDWIGRGVTPKRKKHQTKKKLKMHWTECLEPEVYMTEPSRNVTGVKQVERLLVGPHCQDAEQGRPGTFTASNWPIITTVMSKLEGAGNNLPWWKEISLRMEGVLVTELPCENKVTDSSLVTGVWTQHWGKYLTKARTVKHNQ